MTAIPHPVELRFTELGTAAIVAEGLVSLRSGGLARGIVTKTVVVLP
jgi:hypothetical protein